MRPDAFGICLLKQTASGAQSVASPSKIEGFRELEADLSALFIPKGKDGKRMKKIKMFMGAVLCMNLLAVSGCDSVVQSAVVEEKNPTDQKREENKETVQKTVAEQVGAPETYQATIQADLRSAEREDKENPMKFTLTADAPVKVSDVDAICLKKVKRVLISEEEQNKIKDTFGKGQPCRKRTMRMNRQGRIQ